MRITILSCVILLFTSTAFAASRLPQSAKGSEESKPPKTLYSKGKGTIGLVSVLLLGPIGWIGVRVLSRNKVQRTKASKGLGIWTTVVVAVACIFLIVLVTKATGGKPDLTNTNFNFNGGGGSAPVPGQKKKPESEATSQPPTYVP
jgi:ABC-type Fe3+ transport system permease subunit